MNKLKELQEKLGAARKKLNQFTNDRAEKLTELTSLSEKDELSEEQVTRFNVVKDEIDQIDQKIEMQNTVVDNLNTQIANERANGSHLDGTFRYNDTGSEPTGEEKEIQEYSFMEAVRQAMGRGNFTGMVAEMHQEGQKEAKESGITLSGNGLIIPQKVLSSKKLQGMRTSQIRNDVTATTAGTKTIETEGIDFVSLLRNRLVLSQLGARFVTGLSGNIPLTNQTGGFSFGWAATENATAGESTSTYSQQTLSPKRGTGFMDVSNQWLIQTSPEIEAELVNDILLGTAVGIETAAVNGSGSSGEPEGILQKSGIGVVYAGGADASDTNADGSAQAWDDWVKLEKEVEVDNANFGSLGYLTNAKVKSQARLTKVDTGSGIFIWDKLMAEDANIAVSEIVPSDLEKGSSGTTLSALIYGNFSDLWVGQWGGLELMPNPYTKAKDAITEMILHVYVDVATRREASFAAVTDISAS